MHLTESEVRQKLGLVSAEEAEYNGFLNLAKYREILSKEAAIRSRYRQTGRTTNMIVEALVVMSGGMKVALFGYEPNITTMIQAKAREYMTKLGIDQNMLLRVSKPYQANGIVAQQFFDHYSGRE